MTTKKSTNGEPEIEKRLPFELDNDLAKKLDQLIGDPAFKNDPKRKKAVDLDRQAFMKFYGAFLLLWQFFELMVEIAIMRQLSMTPDITSTLFAAPTWAGFIKSRPRKGDLSKLRATNPHKMGDSGVGISQ